MRAVLLGAGGISEAHLKAIARLAGIRAAAVADVNVERAQECAERYGVNAYADYAEMLEAERPDIAIIALPHFLHRDAAVRALEAGCHLLLEKPMAISSEDCDAILEAAERHGRTVLVGHTQQYLPFNIAAKRLIREAGPALGKLVQINENRYGPYFVPHRPAWFLDRAKSGGGIVSNLGAHCVDKLQWLTDSRIVRIRANLSFEAPEYPDIEGSASMLMETDRGVSCTVNLGGYEGIRREETELLFTGGMIRILNHQGLWISRDGQYEEIAVDRSADPFELQLIDLMRCIREGTQPYASGKYGRTVVRAIETVYASHAARQELAVPQ